MRKCWSIGSIFGSMLTKTRLRERLPNTLVGADCVVWVKEPRPWRRREAELPLISILAERVGWGLPAVGLPRPPPTGQIKTAPKGHFYLRLAERVGFEPTVPVKVRQFSRLEHSTALPPLHSWKFTSAGA